MSEFSYYAAFERNLGWVTEAEQLALRGKRVAIAGMGGVGGVHLITLARLGIGAFHIADFDQFSLANFNRQMGANLHTLDRPKAAVMEEMALAINPELRITRFDEGVSDANLEAFLAGVDLFVDGFDFFVLGIRRRVFAYCHQHGIPAITAGPIGMGTALLAFVPSGMSFEQYFRMEGRPELEQYLRFLIGLVPRGLHRPYLVDPSRLNLAAKTGPSTGAACQLCAGVAAVAAVKLLLGRGDVKPAPWSNHYDAFRGILATTKMRWGLGGPKQRFALWLAGLAPETSSTKPSLVHRLALRLPGAGLIARISRQPPPSPTFRPEDPIDEILYAARWAPSGDNEQPWRFKKLGQGAIQVRVSPHDPANVYHYRDGQPDVLATGMLLESLRIAASMHGRRAEWHVEAGVVPLTLHVQFVADETIQPDRLYAALGQRSVDRNRYRSRQLRTDERLALEAALDGLLRIDWYSTIASRWKFARLSALATNIRLRAPEALPIHRNIIDWNVTLSPTKIPATALGLRQSTLRIMRWAMRDWGRTRLMNRLGGATSAALEMDYVPILSSAAAFTLRFASTAEIDRGPEAVLRAGEKIQRFWLTATRLGLALQPALAVLIFAHYGQSDIQFTADTHVRASAKRLARGFRDVLGAPTDDFVFMGRVGEPLRREGVSRSVRRPVAELMNELA